MPELTDKLTTKRLSEICRYMTEQANKLTILADMPEQMNQQSNERFRALYVISPTLNKEVSQYNNICTLYFFHLHLKNSIT